MKIACKSFLYTIGFLILETGFLWAHSPCIATKSSTINAQMDSIRNIQNFQASFGSIDQRYLQTQYPTSASQKTLKLVGWKGEKLNAQILVETESAQSLEIEIQNFKGKKILPYKICETFLVKSVITDELGEGCGYRKPEQFKSSLSPDLLQPFSKNFSMDSKSLQAVWITLEIPKDVVEGNYTSEIIIKNQQKNQQRLQIQLQILNHVLPKPAAWTYHLDLWQHPSSIARVNGLKMWSDAHFEKMKPIMKRLADAGQKVITATLNKDPWNVQTYDPYADMIIWTKKKDGSWSYDYRVFDRWISMMMDLGITQEINCYSIIPWNNQIQYQDENIGNFVDVETAPGTSEFEELWGNFLQDFQKHLKVKGWENITNIAVDERSPEQMKAAFEVIKKYSPSLNIAYADNHQTYKNFPDSKDISIGIGYPYDRKDLEQRRKKGYISTFYICCSDAFPNTFTFSDPAEATYTAWYAMATGFDGMLRWSYNSWVKDPEEDSRFRTWPAGDTSIVYPDNTSSIRFERLREGIQDYEKIRIIKEELRKKNNLEGLQHLEKAIEKLGSNQRTATWNENLNTAKALLNEF